MGSALFGMPFHNYTGVLIGATAIPVWNHKIKHLPRHFGMSGLGAAVGLLELLGHDDSRALNLLGLLAAAGESYEGMLIESEPDRALRPLKRGASGWVTRAGGVLSGPLPLALRLVGFRSPALRRAAAWSGVVGSLLTRYGWMAAGRASAADFRLPLDIPEHAGKPEIVERPEELRAA